MKAARIMRVFAQRLLARNSWSRNISYDGVPKGPVAIAMSGGVDSSVAALFLKNAGHEVFAIHMQNWDEEEEQGTHKGPGVCSSAQDLLDVKRTCRLLDIPLHEVGAHRTPRRDGEDLRLPV
uniref:tRNA-5-taurinomethyluridine 2-sulfurtransferase n=1 Tax=Cryptomonas curvata TaxID=233186 RepID=A0A7S0QQE7_9CRYP|mmetsp:Transcript_44124/g.92310  ORF Transcript_44124/g.92310 Transcript_44124/m.92310 type:complete len:122 (+) Transcript_44124:64-429(+)|eukprot:CAMPEP_0172156158 /NCGR_PEP_ID=MMETSP1050-20130122/3033_1 /TAXON_ID=233186 /ORGANISM="Cryptomonas curvata, Strain CCAP979/52" /LENGTH=121 /DNA_ID=CAMNT_0012825151 /DNA_START=45 /DNA_END=410 /DNA_ORIENTATION=+